MKCIKRQGSAVELVVRVTDQIAAECVASGQWRYTTKGAWKRKGRVRSDG